MDIRIVLSASEDSSGSSFRYVPRHRCVCYEILPHDILGSARRERHDKFNTGVVAVWQSDGLYSSLSW